MDLHVGVTACVDIAEAESATPPADVPVDLLSHDPNS
jgi:hypothetical protein